MSLVSLQGVVIDVDRVAVPALGGYLCSFVSYIPFPVQKGEIS